MDQSSPNPIPSSVLGDSDPATAALLATQPEQAQTIALLYEISHELTSILDREELLRRIAERVKKLVNYQVFAVLLWNESTQMLESVFAQRYENALPSRFQMPLHQGITGTAAAERRTIRVVDVRLDPRYVSCGEEVEVRSELVVPLLLRDRLVGVLDLESTMPQAFSAEHERRSEEHTSELQSRLHLVCRLLLEKKKKQDVGRHAFKQQTAIIQAEL